MKEAYTHTSEETYAVSALLSGLKAPDSLIRKDESVTNVCFQREKSLLQSFKYFPCIVFSMQICTNNRVSLTEMFPQILSFGDCGGFCSNATVLYRSRLLAPNVIFPFVRVNLSLKMIRPRSDECFYFL